MSQAKVSPAKKPVKRKSGSASKSTRTRKPATARKSSTARKASASRAPGRHAGRSGVGPRGKPTISAFGFLGQVARKMSESPSIKAIYDGRLDEGFREELMVAVAFQNQAPYCNWGHRTWASLAGISAEELGQIEKLNLNELDPKVATAITYVRALVSSDWQDASRDLRQQMQEYFTWREIEDIELIAQAMDISNRAGNTLDAMLSRLKGNPAVDSHIIDEAALSGVFLTVTPVALAYLARASNRSYLEMARSLLDYVSHYEKRSTKEQVAV